jgi:hypothetical protein
MIIMIERPKRNSAGHSPGRHFGTHRRGGVQGPGPGEGRAGTPHSSERAFNSASLWESIGMRFPWQSQEYARTCAECGYIWRVPRWAARRHVRSISMISVATRTTIDRGELAREIESASAANQGAGTFQCCPKCGADHFTQHALRGKSPD